MLRPHMLCCKLFNLSKTLLSIAKNYLVNNAHSPTPYRLLIAIETANHVAHKTRAGFPTKPPTMQAVLQCSLHYVEKSNRTKVKVWYGFGIFFFKDLIWDTCNDTVLLLLLLVNTWVQCKQHPLT